MKAVAILRGPLRTRLVLGMGVMLLPLIVLAVGVGVALESVLEVTHNVAHEYFHEVAPIGRLQRLMRAELDAVHGYLFHGLSDSGERSRLAELSRTIDEGFRAAAKIDFDLPAERAAVTAARTYWEEGAVSIRAMVATPSLDEPATAREIERIDGLLDRAQASLDGIHDMAEEEVLEDLQEAREARRDALWVIAWVFVLGLGSAVLMGVGLARSILLPVRALERAASRLDSGDLSQRVGLTATDELGQLGRTFDLMAERLSKANADLEELSTRDSLTGLLNRREFHKQLSDETARSRRHGHCLSLLMVDIDHFKAVNDTFGHLPGDEVLRSVAARISGGARPADRLARYGGEEFVIILPETSAAGATATAERLVQTVASGPIVLSAGQALSITVSVGVATCVAEPDGNEPTTARGDRLIAEAGRALYAAKRAGRNRVCRFEET